LFDRAAKPHATLLLAHGAGAAMDSPFMMQVAALLADCGVDVARFEFPYMRARREHGRRPPPNKMAVLEASMRQAAEALVARAPVYLGGKSMGARVATQLVDALGLRGAVALGYPFHPPDKPHTLRVAHLATVRAPCLIVQGTRDPFGTPNEVASYGLAPAVRLHWIEGADHSLEPLRRSGRTLAQNLREAAESIAAFMR
jgi:uncharacterized protein